MSKNSQQKKGARNKGSLKKRPQNWKKWRARSQNKNGTRVWRAFFRALLFNLPKSHPFRKEFPSEAGWINREILKERKLGLNRKTASALNNSW